MRDSSDDLQSALGAWLAQPSSHGLAAGETVVPVETHISLVYLAGEKAYKLKKAVDFGYADFSTLAKRKAACETEVRLNRRTAPDLYLGVVPVHRAGDGFTLGSGEGEIVDYLVEMRRFDGDALLARRADEGRLEARTVANLAACIARFHLDEPAVECRDGAGRFEDVLDINEGRLRDAAALFPGRGAELLVARQRGALNACTWLMNRRAAAGFVRHCHGDLHLGNVALIDGQATPFDCLEFNEELATTDILYDLAFLLMDLAERAEREPGLAGFANLALAAYCDAMPADAIEATLEGLYLLPLFSSTRATVRAHVNGTLALNADEADERARAGATARRYLGFADRLLDQPEPALIAIGGRSGTGKSTLARGLAPDLGDLLGATHLRSDVIRKQLLGVSLTERLPESAYTPETSARVYETLYAHARTALEARRFVIADAAFFREEERKAIEQAARDLGFTFVGLWLEAPNAVLKERVAARTARNDDPSDAGVAVVERQAAYETGENAWTKLEVSGTPEENLACARATLDAMLRKPRTVL